MEHIDLTFLGLSGKENGVYAALLKLGEATVKELSLETKVERASLYDLLEGLIRKNLIFKKDNNKILHFAPHDPKNILLEMSAKETQLRELLPDLVQQFRTGNKASHVRIHTGEDALVSLYESIINTRGLSSYDIICSEKDWLQMNPRYFNNFKKRRAEKGIRTRLIMETSPVAEERKKSEDAAPSKLSKVKLLPPAFSSLQFSAGCYILPDRVIFIAYRKEHVATEIFSKEITDFMKAIFEMMWKVVA